MKHHWSAPPSILPPPASASASPPALAHSDSGGGQAGHRWRGARAAAGRGGGGARLGRAHVLPPAGFGSRAPRGASPLPSNAAGPLSPVIGPYCPAAWGRDCSSLPCSATWGTAHHRGSTHTPTGTRITHRTTPATALHMLPPKCPQTGQFLCHNPARSSTAAVCHGTAQSGSRFTSILPASTQSPTSSSRQRGRRVPLSRHRCGSQRC